MTAASTELKPPPPKRLFASFLSKFTVLKGASRDLWLVFGIKFLVIVAYSLTNSTLVLWLTSDLGYGDQKALGFVAGWSAVLTLITIMVGPLTDALGLRRTFFVGTGFCILSRAIMGLADQPLLALAFGLIPLAIGEALR